MQQLRSRRTGPPTEPVVKTVLFSDVVASTQLACTHGDAAWLRLVDRHTRAVCAIVRAHGGELAGFLGDGFMVLFDDPGEAVVCALKIAEAAEVQDLFGIRVGLDHGPVIPYREHWFVGVTIHVAARLSDRCRSGEVLLSHRCWKAATERTAVPAAVSTSTEIRGVDEPITVHAIRVGERR